MRDILHIGKITGAHGLRGEVKVFPLTDDRSRFSSLTNCLLGSADEKNRVPAKATGARFLNDSVLLKLQGVDDRDAAEALRGRLLSVTRDQAVALPPDTWFICDLIGCSVWDEAHGLLGELTDVLQTAAHDVYTVHLAGARDLLFPALKTILRRVDLSGRRIEVSLPDGLYEVYR